MVGAGAAGLMAAIAAGRAARASRAAISVAVLDGAARLGAKILISGGGRCNVTHHAVEAADFNGATPAAVRKILRRFGVDATVRFFEELGVSLKREETGKLFPVTDRAKTVLDALLLAGRSARVELVHPWRVEAVAADGDGFLIDGPQGRIRARRVVLATGGRSVPRSGSDGHGYAIARSLGHTTTRVFPALVPLVLEPGSVPTRLSGLATPCRLEVRASGGRRLAEVVGPALCTHFGVSGPAVLDVSRHFVAARLDGPGVRLVVSWIPELTAESMSRELAGAGGRSAQAWLRARLPERLAEALVAESRIEANAPLGRLAREDRRSLALAVCAMPLPVTGDRGFAYAEVTAGGVPLLETRLDTLESRVTPGLHLCGEILDVDGRIGGFNFQWAWASGHVAGESAARLLSA